MHELFLGKLFKKAEHKHLQTFQENGKAINDKVRLYALVGQASIEAKQSAADPFSEIVSLATRRGPSKSQAATTGESIWPYAYESLRWHRKRQKAI
jgi:hypothetical protein